MRPDTQCDWPEYTFKSEVKVRRARLEQSDLTTRPDTLYDWHEYNFKTGVDVLRARLEQIDLTTTTLISVAEQQLETLNLINTNRNYCKINKLVHSAAKALADANIVLTKNVLEVQEVCNNQRLLSSEALRVLTPGSGSDRQAEATPFDASAFSRFMPTQSTIDASEMVRRSVREDNAVESDEFTVVESAADGDAISVPLAKEDKKSPVSDAAGRNRGPAAITRLRNSLTALRSATLNGRAGRADGDDDDDEFSMASPKKQEDSSVTRREPEASLVSRLVPSRLEAGPGPLPGGDVVKHTVMNGTRDDDGGGEQCGAQKRLCSSSSVGRVFDFPMEPIGRRNSQTDTTDANHNDKSTYNDNNNKNNNKNNNNNNNSHVSVHADRTVDQKRVVDVQRGGATRNDCAEEADEGFLFLDTSQVESPPSAFSSPASKFVAGQSPKDSFRVRQPDLYRYVDVFVPSIDMGKKRVYVNKAEDVGVLNEISRELENNYPTQEVSAEELCENETLVIACLNGKKCRARFLRFTEDGNAEVYFLDGGNTSRIPLKEMRLLKTKKSLKTCQLAFPCQLSSQLDQMQLLDKLRKIQKMHGLSMCFSCGSEANDRGERVYTIEDIVPRKGLTNLMPMPESLDLNERVGHQFHVCHVVNTEEIWLLDISEIKLRRGLQLALEQLPLPPCVPPSALWTGSYVVRQSKRARILAVHGDVVDLLMLDSGYTVTGVPVQECRMPPLVTFTLPPTAIKVSLMHCTYNEHNWTEVKRRKLKDVFSNVTVEMRCIEETSGAILIDSQTRKILNKQVQSLGLCS